MSVSSHDPHRQATFSVVDETPEPQLHIKYSTAQTPYTDR
jgi:hypothetical protein